MVRALRMLEDAATGPKDVIPKLSVFLRTSHQTVSLRWVAIYLDAIIVDVTGQAELYRYIVVCITILRPIAQTVINIKVLAAIQSPCWWGSCASLSCSEHRVIVSVFVMLSGYSQLCFDPIDRIRQSRVMNLVTFTCMPLEQAIRLDRGTIIRS